MSGNFDEFLEYHCEINIKQEYKPLIQYLIANKDWDCTSYPFMYEWKQYMKSIDRYWICDNEEHIDTNPPLCLDGLQEKMKAFRPVCTLSENGRWTFAGAIYNWNNELEYFAKHVLSVIATGGLIDTAISSIPTDIVTNDLHECVQDENLSFLKELKVNI